MTIPSRHHPIFTSLIPILLFIILTTPITTLPTIAIVPGAWQSPIHYTKLTTHLRRAGYNVVSRPHPSIDTAFPEAQTGLVDAAAIYANVFFPLIVQQGQDVVLVMHGYGGLVGPALAGGLSKAERGAEGSRGGIVGMVFIAAFVSRAGNAMVGLLPGGRLEDWVVQYPDDQTIPSNPIPLFYNDVSPDLGALFAHELRNQSRAALTTPAGVPAWVRRSYNGRRAYGFTFRDNVVPLAAQEAMAGLTGVDFVTREFDAGHSVFLSRPEEVGDWIAGLAVAWEGGGGGVGGEGVGGAVAVT